MSTRRRRIRHHMESSTEYGYARLMALRTLGNDSRFKAAFKDRFERDRELDQQCLDVDSDQMVVWLQLFKSDAPPKVTPTQLRGVVKDALRATERKPLGSTFRRTIDLLGRIISLDPVDCALIEFVLVAHHNDILVNWLDSASGSSLREDCALLADLLGFRLAEVGQALARNSNLTKYGFVKYDPFCGGFLGRVEMPRDLAAKLSRDYASEDELVLAFLNPVEPSQLSLEDVPHLASHLETLRTVLPNALKSGCKGINILFHGEPGTGKTQVTALLAQLAGLDCYRIIKPDDDDPQSGLERLGYYMIVQRMLANRRPALLVFDEFEDVVPDSDPFARMFGGGGRKSSPMKSWLTQVLEENRVPTVWISNSIRHVDRALLRRFTYAIEFRTPPASVRRRILSQVVDGLDVGQDWIERTANVSNLSPAMMRNAATIASLAGCTDMRATESLLDRTIEGSMRALGRRPERAGVSTVTRYDLSYVNSTVAPEFVLSSLQRTGRGTLCFYGPPGTGKSALGGYLAAQLERPLMIRRASDLLSMWVGGTEENIARMFEEARDENAVLLVDEADSFLADRAGSQRSWEVTQVNEMLSQIEHFDGVLICTTNRLDHLDPAVLRRFSHKVGFAYLKPEQRTAMFFGEFGDQFPKAAHRAQVETALAQHTNLAPGDFATVRRQFDASGGALTLDELLAALAAECGIKPDKARRSMGFT